ncbi:MAG TPA: AraC family transcriptional regulator ligand-binding domain-containing protein [Burkholderiaceae bacterium]|nr:AraC family transcriptional regulator ligand-binding domain-containing protein [Burkholderiaceae bacterium]
MISVAALTGIPEFVRSAFGEPVLRTANRAARLDIEVVERSDCFVPQRTMTAFVDAVARASGAEHFGLELAPYLSLEHYGIWGEYLLGASTLGAAVGRAAATMDFHARGDAMSLDVADGRARIGYASAARGLDGYAHVAWGTIGVVLSLCRSYLPAAWRPQCIEVDLEAPGPRELAEDLFECPVVFGAPGLAVWLRSTELSAAARRATRPLPTFGDLARARSELHRIRGLQGFVANQVWAQVVAGRVSIDSTARSLDISVRTLQRELRREGVEFRTLVNTLRGRRAAELLRQTDASVTQISMALGYAAPAHFARAFRKVMGIGPGEFRRAACPGGGPLPEPPVD